MAALNLPRLGSPMGKTGMTRSWAVFSRPRKTMYLVLSLILLYCLMVSWSNAWHLASALRKADLIKDDRGIGVVLRLGGVEIQGLGEDLFDESQLPFDDVNIMQRKSDDEIRQEFDKEHDEAGK
jgi:hypothetical protein